MSRSAWYGPAQRGDVGALGSRRSAGTVEPVSSLALAPRVSPGATGALPGGRLDRRQAEEGRGGGRSGLTRRVVGATESG